MAAFGLQLHSLTDRPNFPSGLREKRADVVEHLKGLNYNEKGTSMEDLMRMVELGAVEIIQKPLSKERLQNIWQHVVRKMLADKGSKMQLKSASGFTEQTRQKGSAPCTPRTPSPTISFATPSDSTEAKSLEQDVSMSGVAQRDQTAMSDSSSSGVSKRSGPLKTLLHACRPKGKVFGSNAAAPSENGRCTKISVRPTALGTPASGPLVGPCGRAQWPGLMQANPQGGCVWGTPVPPACMPYITSQSVIWDVPAASETTSSEHCQPLPVHEVDSTVDSQPSPMVDLFPLVDEHAAFLVNEVLEGSDDERGAEKSSPSPPIGLKLRKSASFLDLINRSLQMCTPSTMCMH